MYSCVAWMACKICIIIIILLSLFAFGEKCLFVAGIIILFASKTWIKKNYASVYTKINYVNMRNPRNYYAMFCFITLWSGSIIIMQWSFFMYICKATLLWWKFYILWWHHWTRNRKWEFRIHKEKLENFIYDDKTHPLMNY